MTEGRLVIGRRLLQRILEHCLEEKPVEACGILTGRAGRVLHAYATDNARRSPLFFEVEAVQQALVLQQMAERGEEVVGIYHSHPTAPAAPSAHDIDQAVHYPEAIRLIISLNGPADVGAFLIREGRVCKVPLTILSGDEGEFHDLRRMGHRGMEA